MALLIGWRVIWTLLIKLWQLINRKPEDHWRCLRIMTSLWGMSTGISIKMITFWGPMPFGSAPSFWIYFTPTTSRSSFTIQWTTGIWLPTSDRILYLQVSQNIWKIGDHFMDSVTSMAAFGNSRLDRCFNNQLQSQSLFQIKKVIVGIIVFCLSRSSCCAMSEVLSRLRRLICTTVDSMTTLAIPNLKEF